MKRTRIGFFSVSLILGLSTMLFLINSCKHDGIPADQMAHVPFAQVQQVYTDYCVKCHSGGNGGESRLDFTSWKGITATVTAGNSSKSKSYQAMTSTIQLMPPDLAVPTAKRTLVRLWIDQGASQQ